MADHMNFFEALEIPRVMRLNGKRIKDQFNLQKQLDAIHGAITKNSPKSNDIEWIESRKEELNQFKHYIPAMRGRGTNASLPCAGSIDLTMQVVDIKMRDLKGDWGYDVEGLKNWVDKHQGVFKDCRKTPFTVRYQRDHYGVWSRTLEITDPNYKPKDMKSGRMSESDFEKVKERFMAGQRACECWGQYALYRDLHSSESL